MTLGPQQFCSRGHDTFVTGRTKSRNCVACQTDRSAATYQSQKDVFKDRAKQWAKENPERRRVIRKESDWRRRGVLDFSIEDYDRMVAEQGGRCYICDKTPMRDLDVDHDHDTGRVRALLCNPCNRMVERKYQDYLEKV